MTHIGNSAAKRTVDTGKTRDESAFQAHFFDQGAGMQCAATTGGHGCEVLGVEAALDGNQTDGSRHPGIGDPDDGVRCRHDVKPQRRSDAHLDGRLGRIHVQAIELVAHRLAGINSTQGYIGIGYRRAVIALAVTHRARVGPCRLGPDLQ